VFSLLCRNLMAAYLCWAGWFVEYVIMVSVKEGFLYMEIFQLVRVLWIVMSRKFSLLLVSVSAVNLMFGWSVLKSFCMLSMSVWLGSWSAHGIHTNLGVRIATTDRHTGTPPYM